MIGFEKAVAMHEPVDEAIIFSNERLKALEIFMEFQLRALIETSNALVKSVPFYLAIIGFLLAYVLTQTSNEGARMTMLSGGVIVSAFYGIGIALVARGIWHGLNNIESVLRDFNPEIFQSLRMSDFIGRGRRVVLFSLLLVETFLVVFVFVLVAMLTGLMNFPSIDITR